ncbi:16S rRNA (cytidine(1402)-2'-O)-methyltransferase [Paenibacillus arenosi]|uniref:Ribosomal RNA small subunit methyltransferase I n=1 Tax=Paenibacillus arenosi TaxID=2774142 RepID=A0ABR9B5F3_9BACL|nr:16S rRNA (cytidine(1402)-2'-O)-methyltransferase [Paenibacillus arenosi]MBD8500662.1 16S rRNA (cytidine(1402)-2'-O)-methyltransferase [Paenibacillus arenosi]
MNNNCTIQNSYASSDRKQGELYLVATPIGNLEDMTYRAVRMLQEADLIAAEDTRETRKLLSHFDIQGKTLYSYHEHNKDASGPELVRLMQEGRKLALVSDAGLPAISDPGADLVRLAIEAGLPVVPIPGANAALSALIASGLPTDRFTFVGFLPRDKKRQEEILQSVQRDTSTLLFYESPHRIVKTLERMIEQLGDREVVVARELTKRYEQFVRGTISSCLRQFEEVAPIGECCIVVQGAVGQWELPPEQSTWWASLSVAEHVARYEEEQGATHKEAMKLAAKDRGVSRRDIYQQLLSGEEAE